MIVKLARRKLTAQAPLPRLPESRPRPVRLTGTGKAVVFIGVLLLAASPLVAFYLHSLAVNQRALRAQIEREAVSATAEVTALTRTRGDSPRYYASFQFGASGQAFQGRTKVGRSYWSRLSVGGPVPVRYLPSDPRQSWIRGYEPSRRSLWDGPLVALALALTSLAPWFSLRWQWMLLMDGREAEARVTAVKKVQGSKGGRTSQVSFEFRTPSGGVRTGRYSTQKPPPADGESIRIIYDPDNPGRNAPYPLSLVRADR